MTRAGWPACALLRTALPTNLVRFDWQLDTKSNTVTPKRAHLVVRYESRGRITWPPATRQCAREYSLVLAPG